MGIALIDLHTHSNASDGSYPPAALLAEAEKRGITALALTDHDTTGGLDEAAKAAAGYHIRFIPGIELQINWNQGGEFHLLGLGIHAPSENFRAAVKELALERRNRNMEILDRMNEAGIEAGYGDIGAEGQIIGRPHFADFLVRRKIVKNREMAFSRFLGKGRPFYVPKTGLEFNRAVELIKESGGIAVLAHPMSLYTAWGKLPELVKQLKDNGLDGLEAWHPTAKVSACKRLEELGRELGLVVTAGSDFHGQGRPDRKLGITAGGKKIDESFLDALPEIITARTGG